MVCIEELKVTGLSYQSAWLLTVEADFTQNNKDEDDNANDDDDDDDDDNDDDVFCQGRNLYDGAVKAGKRDIHMVTIMMTLIINGDQ